MTTFRCWASPRPLQLPSRRQARKGYRKIRQAATDHGSAEGVAKASARKEKETYTMIQVSKIKSAFPTKDSPRLKKLVDEMVKFDLVIVVGLKDK